MNKNIIITILAIISISSIGFIAYDKLYTKEENEPATIQISKLDDTKYWVHEADYNLPTQKESYCAYMTDDCRKVIKASEIVVPYININSEDAKKANDEIYNLYKELINKYNDYLKEEIYYTTVEYKVQNNGNIISIVIITTSGGSAPEQLEYYTYSFNINNGKVVSYQELYKELGYTKEILDNKVKTQITKELDQFDKTIYPEGTTSETYVNKSVDTYTNQVNENKLKYFIDDQNRLNVVITLAIEDLIQGTHTYAIVIE